MLGLDDRTGVVAIDACAAVTGNVLQHRQDPAVEEAFANRAGKAGYALRIAAIRTIADHLIGAVHRDVENRKAVDGDADPCEIIGDQPRAEPCCFRREWIRQCRDPPG